MGLGVRALRLLVEVRPAGPFCVARSPAYFRPQIPAQAQGRQENTGLLFCLWCLGPLGLFSRGLRRPVARGRATTAEPHRLQAPARYTAVQDSNSPSTTNGTCKGGAGCVLPVLRRRRQECLEKKSARAKRPISETCGGPKWAHHTDCDFGRWFRHCRHLLSAWAVCHFQQSWHLAQRRL